MKSNMKMIRVSPRREKFLAAWRYERNLVRQICPEAVREEKKRGGPCLPLDPYDVPVRVGDIRLLARGLSIAADGLAFVAILFIRDGVAVAAPFSKYAAPATKDEWLINLDAPLLKVLELWNAQPFPVRELEKSWTVTTLTKKQLARAQMLYKCSVLGVLPAAKDREDIGLAVMSRQDERNAYMQEEFALYAPLHRAMMEYLEEAEAKVERSETFASRLQLLLAEARANWKTGQNALAAKGKETTGRLTYGKGKKGSLPIFLAFHRQQDNGKYWVRWTVEPASAMSQWAARKIIAVNPEGRTLAEGVVNPRAPRNLDFRDLPKTRLRLLCRENLMVILLPKES